MCCNAYIWMSKKNLFFSPKVSHWRHCIVTRKSYRSKENYPNRFASEIELKTQNMVNVLEWPWRNVAAECPNIKQLSCSTFQKLQCGDTWTRWTKQVENQKPKRPPIRTHKSYFSLIHLYFISNDKFFIIGIQLTIYRFFSTLFYDYKI